MEILLTRSPDALASARSEYPKRHGVSLEEDIAQDTSGDFRKTVFPLSRVSVCLLPPLLVDECLFVCARLEESGGVFV